MQTKYGEFSRKGIWRPGTFRNRWPSVFFFSVPSWRDGIASTLLSPLQVMPETYELYNVYKLCDFNPKREHVVEPAGKKRGLKDNSMLDTESRLCIGVTLHMRVRVCYVYPCVSACISSSSIKRPQLLCRLLCRYLMHAGYVYVTDIDPSKTSVPGSLSSCLMVHVCGHRLGGVFNCQILSYPDTGLTSNVRAFTKVDSGKNAWKWLGFELLPVTDLATGMYTLVPLRSVKR